MSKAIIVDLQTGEYSDYTSVTDMFNDYVDEYLMHCNFGVDLTPAEEEEQAVKQAEEFAGYSLTQQVMFLHREYGYFIVPDPSPFQIKLYEEETGKTF